jgi:hypothetical protein
MIPAQFTKLIAELEHLTDGYVLLNCCYTVYEYSY